MSLDLNTQSGFNALTGGVGAASTLLTSLTGAIASKWDIRESAYGHDGKFILFHVFGVATKDGDGSSINFNAAVDNVQDTSGRRKVPLVFPYQDGQSTDDLGREGEIYDFNILISGPNYKAQYKKLLAEFNKPTPGTLVHPIRGQLTVVAQSWIVTHQSSQKQAVAMRVRFMEHSFSVQYSTSKIPANVPSALTTAIGFVAAISKVITAVQSAEFILANTKNLVSALLNGYLSGFTSSLNGLNQTFNNSGPVSGTGGSLIPGLSPTVAGQDPTVFSVVNSPTNAFSGTQSTVATQGSQQLTAALASQQAIDNVSALRTSLQGSIVKIENSEDGQGALIFYDEILLLKQSAVALQEVLELGLQTSKNSIVTYKTPRDMSVREVCFSNGLTPDDSYDIEVLNPQLLSLNLIPKGTIVQVPT